MLTPATPAAFIKSITDMSINQVGLPDKKFGIGGLIKQSFLTLPNVFDLATGLVVVPNDKKVVLAGYTGDPLAVPSEWKIVLVRYFSTGQIDTGFGDQGIVLQQFSPLLYDQINTVIAYPNGALLVAGETRSGGIGQYKFLLARYLNTGILDASFGFGGVVNQPFLGTGSYDEINALCLQSNGFVLAAGYSKDGGGQKIALARYTSAGVLDGSFGQRGIVLQSFLGTQHLDVGVAVIVSGDGTILVAGTSSDGGVGLTKGVLLRYNTAGSLVTAFGNGGVVLQPCVGTGNQDAITCMVQQGNGSILIGGSSVDAGGQKALLIRYTSGGVLDPTFGNGGIMKQPFLGVGVTTDVINSIALQPDGKIVVAGATNDGAGNKYFLARYQANGVLDKTFGVAGIVKSPFIGDGNGDELHDVMLSPDGAIIASGYTQDGGGSKMFVTRTINAIDFSYYGAQSAGLLG